MEVTKSIEERVILLYKSLGDIYSLTYSSDMEEVNFRWDRLDWIVDEFKELIEEANELKIGSLGSKLEEFLLMFGTYLEIAKLEFDGNELTTTPSNLHKVRNAIRTNRKPPRPVLKIIEESSEQNADTYCSPKRFLEKRIKEYLNPNVDYSCLEKSDGSGMYGCQEVQKYIVHKGDKNNIGSEIIGLFFLFGIVFSVTYVLSTQFAYIVRDFLGN